MFGHHHAPAAADCNVFKCANVWRQIERQSKAIMARLETAAAVNVDASNAATAIRAQPLPLFSRLMMMMMMMMTTTTTTMNAPFDDG